MCVVSQWPRYDKLVSALLMNQPLPTDKVWAEEDNDRKTVCARYSPQALAGDGVAPRCARVAVAVSVLALAKHVIGWMDV
jgi:hypothetical protein